MWSQVFVLPTSPELGFYLLACNDASWVAFDCEILLKAVHSLLVVAGLCTCHNPRELTPGLTRLQGPSTKYLKPVYPDFTHAKRDQDAIDRGNKYILQIYARAPFVLSHGKGSWIWDTAGRKYLDFSAGIAVNALGHADEGVMKVRIQTADPFGAVLILTVLQVLQEQTGKLLHTSNLYHNEYAGKLAELLVELTKSHDTPSFDGGKVFFANSGTEANEGALKIARKVGKERWAKATGKPSDDPSCDKYEIVCFENGFHGRSMGALSVTTNPKYQNPFTPLIPGVRVGELNAQESIDNLISDKTCAVIVEAIQGEGGIQSASADWLAALRKKCDEVGAVLIFDEIQVRSGPWLSPWSSTVDRRYSHFCCEVRTLQNWGALGTLRVRPRLQARCHHNS
jgi:acetylornithine aminotransferase